MAQQAVCDLLSNPVGLDAEDLLNGHCETVAVVTAEAYIKQLDVDLGRVGSAAEVGQRAHTELDRQLRAAEVPEQISILFEPQRQREVLGGASKDRFGMWRSVMAHDPAAAAAATALDESEPADLTMFLAGESPSLPKRLAEAISVCSNPMALPLYVTNYIWDGDELTDSDLQVAVDETAMYSIHAVGLVLDPMRRVVHIADPNGPLLKGGSMEFLTLPFTTLRHRATTALSQYDRDLSEETEEIELTRPNKRGRR